MLLWHLCSKAFWASTAFTKKLLSLLEHQLGHIIALCSRCHPTRMYHKLGRRTAITKLRKLVRPIAAHLNIVSQRSLHPWNLANQTYQAQKNTSSTSNANRQESMIRQLFVDSCFIKNDNHQLFAQSTVRSRCFTLCCTAVAPRPRGAPLATAQPIGAQHNWSTKTRPETLDA